jgi:hypothetical protein
MARSPLLRVLVLGSVVAAVVVAAFWLGYTRLGRVETDPVSEESAVVDAHQIAQGQQRYGIAKITHYPNGPTYLLALLFHDGQDVRQGRVLALAVSAVCLGALLCAALAVGRTPLLQLYGVLAVAAFLAQPGFLDWQGGVHEHSYALSLTLLTIAVGCLLPSQATAALFALGFVSGWFGYDFLPGQTVALLIVRWVYYCQAHPMRPVRAAARSVLDVTKLVSGIAVAILTHLAQNTLYFGGLTPAVRDLLGPAAARMNLSTAQAINPEYVEFLRKAGGDPPPRGELVAALTRAFFLETWSAGRVLLAVGVSAVALTAVAAGGKMVRARMGIIAAARQLFVIMVAVVLSYVTSVVWTAMMPRHAMFHFHFLPRHFLITLALVVVLPACLSRLVPAADRPVPLGAPALRELALYGTPLLLLVAVCVLTLWMV